MCVLYEPYRESCPCAAFSIVAAFLPRVESRTLRSMVLTPKQARFVTEYLVDLNATQAAIRAGYSAKTARQMGTENLSKPVIAEAIAQGQKKRSDDTGITAAWVLQRLKIEAENTGFGSSQAARVSALALCMKHLGMLKEDAPHPDRPKFEIAKLNDDQKRTLLQFLRLVCGTRH